VTSDTTPGPPDWNVESLRKRTLIRMRVETLREQFEAAPISGYTTAAIPLYAQDLRARNARDGQELLSAIAKHAAESSRTEFNHSIPVYKNARLEMGVRAAFHP